MTQKEKSIIITKSQLTKTTWELSSAGRASALQAEGHRFEPYSSHWYGRVVQLVRMPACHAGGRGFEPLLGRKTKSIYQKVGAFCFSLYSRGSNPVGVFALKKAVLIKLISTAFNIINV